MGGTSNYFTVTITKDKMEAFLDLTKPGVELTEEMILDIFEEVNKKNIKVDLDQLKVKILGSTGLDKIVIAKGIPPKHGEDGYVQLHYQSKDIKPTILEDGSVNYYDLGYVTNVKEGEVLATIHPPKPGTDGIAVTGEPIPFKPGKPAKLPLGKNVEYLSESNKIIAKVSGQVSLVDNKLNVFEVLEVKEVNFKTGNIDFIGSVVVQGDIREGFTVKAKGDVTVNGIIDSSYVYCDGNLTVKGGIQGRNKGEVSAGGNIIVRYIENCHVKGGGTIVVKDAIMHSNVYSSQGVLVTEGKGLIVGGIIGAEKEILANIVGSPKGTKTELEVGVNPELTQKLQSLTKELTIKNEELKKAKQAQRLLKLKEQQKGDLPKEQRILLEKLETTINILSSYIQENQQVQKEMLDKLLNCAGGKVKVKDIVYPGVKVTIGTRYRNIKDQVNSPTFLVGPDGEIIIT